jgi:hypothetical protein
MFYALGRGKLLNKQALNVHVSFYSALRKVLTMPHVCIDSIVKRSVAFPLNSSTPLLSYTVSFCQVTIGAGRLSMRLPV